MSRAVVFDRFGGPEVLHVVDEPDAPPGSGEVRIRIRAFAINPLDAMMRAGTSPRPVPLPHARLGIEGTGTIEAIGDGVERWAPGDEVIVAAIPDAWVHGSYAETTTLPADRLIPRPPGLDAPEAAAIWVAFSTAYGALVERGGMRPGDRVVVSGASGSVGRAAIQIANQLGAIPVALTRDPAKRDELVGAGAADVVVTDRQDAREAIRGLTGRAGADLVLDLVRGPGVAALAETLRPGGTFVAAGVLDPRPAPLPSGMSLRILLYTSFADTLDPAVVARMSAFLAAGVRLGALRAAVDRVLGFDDVVEAHRILERGEHGGRKLVVAVD